MLQVAKNLNEFMSMSGEEQQLSLMKMCSRCKTIAHLNTYTDKDGNKIANPLWFADWLVTKDDYLTASAEAYCKLFDVLADNPKISFPKALFRACWNALQGIYRNELKHISALVKAVDSDDPEMDGVPVIDLEAYEVKQVFTAPEDYVFIDTLLEACHGWKDKFIISKRADGFDNVEIAEMLGCSRQAVDKRLVSIHKRFRG